MLGVSLVSVPIALIGLVCLLLFSSCTLTHLVIILTEIKNVI
uniref:Uncharacterized protein n=1 Tax=Manihot esculenta TaxID=3983 RepID=A0A2C9W8M6_MANES